MRRGSYPPCRRLRSNASRASCTGNGYPPCRRLRSLLALLRKLGIVIRRVGGLEGSHPVLTGERKVIRRVGGLEVSSRERNA